MIFTINFNLNSRMFLTFRKSECAFPRHAYSSLPRRCSTLDLHIHNFHIGIGETDRSEPSVTLQVCLSTPEPISVFVPHSHSLQSENNGKHFQIEIYIEKYILHSE